MAAIDHAVLVHATQHVSRARVDARGVAIGIEGVGSLGEPGEQRALDRGQRLRRFPEIAVRRHLDAPRSASEIDQVEIELENFRFGQGALHARGDDHLAQFSFVGDIVPHKQVLGDLLRNGRAALRPARLRQVADERAHQPALVDACVLIEALVFGGDERVAYHVRDGGKRHRDTSVVRCINLCEALAFVAEDHARARQLQMPELRDVGQVLDRVVVEGDDLTKIDGRALQFLELAELPIGHVEVAEFNPLSALISALSASLSSAAVAIRSSRLMSSMSKALRMWTQPAFKSCVTSARSLNASNSVFTASGRVVTWLKASAVAKSLMRIESILLTVEKPPRKSAHGEQYRSIPTTV